MILCGVKGRGGPVTGAHAGDEVGDEVRDGVEVAVADAPGDCEVEGVTDGDGVAVDDGGN